MHKRIVGKCMGGPLDGQRFSVNGTQDEITTGQFETVGSGKTAKTVAVGVYVKQPKTQRAIERFEDDDTIEAEDAGFEGHGVDEICEFHYEEAKT